MTIIFKATNLHHRLKDKKKKGKKNKLELVDVEVKFSLLKLTKVQLLVNSLISLTQSGTGCFFFLAVNNFLHSSLYRKRRLGVFRK